MALVTNIDTVPKGRPSVHQPTECSGAFFTVGGKPYLQLDTFGSPDRKLKGTVAQSIQFDREAAKQLKALIDEAFPGL